MDNHQITSKKYSSLKKFGLFKKNSKTPGNIKQVRGAQYPPMYDNTHQQKHKNTHMIHNHNRRNSSTLTINCSENKNNNNIDPKTTIIDIEKLLQSIKDDEHRYHSPNNSNNNYAIHETNHPPMYNSTSKAISTAIAHPLIIEPKPIKEWDQIQTYVLGYDIYSFHSRFQ